MVPAGIPPIGDFDVWSVLAVVGAAAAAVGAAIGALDARIARRTSPPTREQVPESVVATDEEHRAA